MGCPFQHGRSGRFEVSENPVFLEERLLKWFRSCLRTLMAINAEEVLRLGSEIVAPVLLKNGFTFSVLAAGASSGGRFASGEFRRGTRRLELHFRHSLGMVRYHFGEASMSHQEYMRLLLGKSFASHYPGFSDEPLDAFRHLLLDLQQYASGFLGGSDQELLRCIEDARGLPEPKPGLPG
jgi:hypothetical protein